MSNVLKISVAAAFVFLMSPAVHGAEYEVHPSIAVSEEFTDNVFGTIDKRTSDFITRVLPGLAAKYQAPALNADLSYVFDYRHYARKSHADETVHSLSTKAKLEVAENLLFLDISDQYQRVSLNVSRNMTTESLFVDQTDQNILSVSPYFTLRPSERIPVKVGYKFNDVRYFNTSSTKNTGQAVDKTIHIGFLDLAYELSTRFSLTAGYTFVRELSDADNLNQHQALGGFRYEYADKSFVFAQAGNNWIEYDNGQHLYGMIWSAGLTHVFDTATVSILTGVKFDEDPLRNVTQESFVSGTFEQRFKRGSISLSPSYSEYVQTETDSVHTKKYGAMVQVNYELANDLNSRVSFAAEKFEQPSNASNTERLAVNAGLSYLLAEKLTASLTYIYVQYTSPGIIANNYHVNRAMLEIRYLF